MREGRGSRLLQPARTPLARPTRRWGGAGRNMKAVIQDRYGKADTLKLGDAETPVPDATSVLLRVRSASVNGLDWRVMSGRPFILRFLGFGLTRPKRRIRGVDVAGEVIAVRKPDSRFKVGDAVFGLGSGSFAEYVAADEREITNKPVGVSFDDAATLGIAAFTALQALRDRGHVQPGQSVAVTGAGSGVGTFAVQLAKWMGAHVTAVTRTDNVETLRSVGADVVVDYLKADFTDRPDRFDIIFDVSGRNGIGTLLRILKPGGTLVIVGGRGGLGRIIQAGLRRRLLRQRVWGLMAKPNVDDLTKLGSLVAQGTLRPVIDHVYTLPETPGAMARAELLQARGKLVIRVS
jgi:NADPH:quinone reductase-like Zn-dependent oxidoreductase